MVTTISEMKSSGRGVQEKATSKASLEQSQTQSFSTRKAVNTHLKINMFGMKSFKSTLKKSIGILMKMAEDIEATALQILFASGGFTIPTMGTRRLKMAGVSLLKLWKNLMLNDY